MTNVWNRQLGDGECKDFGTAIEALRCAMRDESTRYDSETNAFFAKEAEKCAKAKEIYDRLYAQFRKKLSSELAGAGLDEFCDCVDKDDYTLLHY